MNNMFSILVALICINCALWKIAKILERRLK
nr:MAG TPA: hypothetical protein [Caudoviricetes sp.]